MNINVAERSPDADEEYSRMKDFFTKSTELLQYADETFERYYLLATKIWMSDIMQSTEETTLRRDMSLESRKLNFSALYRRLCLESDLETRMHGGQTATR